MQTAYKDIKLESKDPTLVDQLGKHAACNDNPAPAIFRRFVMEIRTNQ